MTEDRRKLTFIWRDILHFTKSDSYRSYEVRVSCDNMSPVV